MELGGQILDGTMPLPGKNNEASIYDSDHCNQVKYRLVVEDDERHERAPMRRAKVPVSNSRGSPGTYGQSSSEWGGNGPPAAEEAPYWQMGAPELNRNSSIDEKEN